MLPERLPSRLCSREPWKSDIGPNRTRTRDPTLGAAPTLAAAARCLLMQPVVDAVAKHRVLGEMLDDEVHARLWEVVRRQVQHNCDSSSEVACDSLVACAAHHAG